MIVSHARTRLSRIDLRRTTARKGNINMKCKETTNKTIRSNSEHLSQWKTLRHEEFVFIISRCVALLVALVVVSGSVSNALAKVMQIFAP